MIPLYQWLFNLPRCWSPAWNVWRTLNCIYCYACTTPPTFSEHHGSPRGGTTEFRVWVCVLRRQRKKALLQVMCPQRTPWATLHIVPPVPAKSSSPSPLLSDWAYSYKEMCIESSSAPVCVCSCDLTELLKIFFQSRLDGFPTQFHLHRGSLRHQGVGLTHRHSCGEHANNAFPYKHSSFLRA